MAKAILFNAVDYSMLQALAKRNRSKPEEYIKKLVQEAYAKLK
jgi:hypothetical protein